MSGDQRLCIRYIDSTIHLLSKLIEFVSICTAWFMSDQVGNPEDRFSRYAAHVLVSFISPIADDCSVSDRKNDH